MTRFLPYILAGVGLITVYAAFAIPPTAPKHTLLEEQQSERLVTAGMIGFMLLCSGLFWMAARLWKRRQS
jgi:hypothetical protein